MLMEPFPNKVVEFTVICGFLRYVVYWVVGKRIKSLEAILDKKHKLNIPPGGALDNMF